MKNFLFHIALLPLLILVGTSCSELSKEPSDKQNQTILSEIKLLSKSGEDLPDIVSDQDIENCKQALELTRAIENRELELNCLICLFRLQNKQENFRDALQTGNLALRLATENHSTSEMAEVYKLFGKNYYHLSAFHKSFESFEKSLALYIALKDTINQQDVLNMQGNIYFNWDDYEMAYDYYRKTFELSDVRNDNDGIAKAMTNMGVVFAARTNEAGLHEDSVSVLSERAIQYILNAIRFNEKTDEKVRQAEILNNLSIIYRQTGKTDLALETIREARNIARPLSDRVYASTSLSYATILQEVDSVSRAEEVLESTLAMARQKELNVHIINILDILSEINAERNDYEKAYEFRKEHASLSDSIFNLDYKKKIDAIKITSEMETILQQQKLLQQQNFYQTLIIVTGLLFIIITVLLLYSRLRARSANIRLENKLLNEHLETRNKELTTRIMALIQRNELEKEIVQKMNALKPKLKKENQEDASDIIRSLSFKQNDQLWKEFEVRFESVHQEFFNKINEKYPDLTTNEKKLCAFLYLDMSSKDISAITGQSIRALNVARTRLRKKFDLTNESQSLSGHLNGL